MGKQMSVATEQPIDERLGNEQLRRTANRLMRRYPEVGVTTALLILVTVFSLATPKFTTVDSATGILAVAADVGTVALGVCFLMIAGEFDISVGSVYLISTLIFVRLANGGLEPVLAFLATLAVCALIGTLNGMITVKVGIPSFIVTLGGLMFYRGIHIVLTRGFSVTYQADKSFLFLIGGNPFSLFRNTIIWWFGFCLILQAILGRTKYGNWVFSTGGDAVAARNVGVPVSKVKVINFALCSLLAGFAGVSNVARFLTSQSQLAMGMEFEAITAAVIGGTLLTGGKGSIVGALIGALFISVIRTGLVMTGFSSYIYMPVTGIILLVAVIINRMVTGIKF